MSNPRGFIEIEHKAPSYRDVEERIKDFQEVELKLSENEIAEQALRCMDCGVPFCHGSGCPLGNYIPEWNELVSEGYWKEALQLLLATNEFPEFTGKICPALCEGSCTVGLNSESVAIRQIELALIEKGFENEWIKPFIPKKRTGKRVAIVGSGPAGLATASRLNKLGHKVTVFEKDKKPGGLLRYGIPDFKLDKATVERRINLMKVSGIKFECNLEVGTDISGDYLLKRFDAVCLANGAMVPRNLEAPGRNLDGIHYAMDFLRQQNCRIENEEFSKKEITATDKNVIVIGGGDTGSDCVGTSIRQDATSITQLEIMPKPPIKRDSSTPWPLWPYKLRTSSSHKEGCRRVWNIMTTGFEASEDGKVTKINTVKVEWKFTDEGVPASFEKIPGSESSLKADLILLAMGFTGAEPSKLMEQLNVSFDKRGNISIDEKGNVKCKANNVFAAGDAASGASLVVRAMHSGCQLAETISNFLCKH
jgi:glutamate synthase (NADPH) small chain